MTASETADPFRSWALVEIFGHERIAGEVSEQTVAGHGFIRVDVPELDGLPGFTRLYGHAAIYSITPVSEEIARRAAASMRARPVNVYLAPSPDPASRGSGIAGPAVPIGPVDDSGDDEFDDSDGDGF